MYCIVAKDWDTGSFYIFDHENMDEFEDFSARVDHWIGHNFIEFDLYAIKKVLGIRIRPSRVTDTLLVSRLQKQSREGGHSLENWGRILKYPKLPHKDFSKYTSEMLEYCINDVELTYKVACYLKSEGKGRRSAESERIEHMSQYLLSLQSRYGFALDVKRAHKLFAEIKERAEELEKKILEESPPRPVLVSKIEPKYKKDGGLNKSNLRFMGDEYTQVGGPFTRIDWKEFDLNSPKQKVERLEGWWEPTVRTKGYRNLCDKLRNKEITQQEFNERQRTMWKVCEENLETLKDDAPQSLKYLTEHAMCVSRCNVIEGWFDALGKDDRIHGKVISIGAITHRMAHHDPNLGNIPSTDSPYGGECRSCFVVPHRYRLVGVDASGIQLRILAHYMNDDDYIHAVTEGDVHTKNLEAMGISKGEWDSHEQRWTRRSVAKTFIYAWLLGAGNEKVGLITGTSPEEGKRIKERFLRNTPALADLKEEANHNARRGYMVGLDGRHLEIKSAHYALSQYLQGAEQAIMKKAMITYHQRAQKAGLDFHQVAVVHDEFQIETHKDHAEELGEIVVQSIIDAGKHFKMNCPLDGEYKIGNNWKETH